MLMIDIANEYCTLRDRIIEKLYSHLNDMQRQAVLTTSGPLLILAGAGSGKTTVLTNRVAHLVKFGDIYKSDFSPKGLTMDDLKILSDYLENMGPDKRELPENISSMLGYRGVFPSSILAITFTNKAAKEMKERIFRLVGEQAKDIWVSTFHSTCVRILRRDIDKIGYGKNFVIYDDSDQLIVVKECLKELDINEKYFNPKEVRSVIGHLKDELKSHIDYAKEVQGQYREEKLAKLYALYESKLKKNNALDFNDLLSKTLELFYLHEDVLRYYRKKFHYVLVDEYQDTNFAQYMLVKLLSDTYKNICVVGDDDQSIYRWRGADIRNILDFEKDFTDTYVVKLEENYRSFQNILDAANQVIRNNKGRKEKSLWTQKEKGDRLRIYKAYNEQQEAEFICNEIKNHINSGGRASDVAVLYRMNAQSRALEEALIKYAIPYNIYGGQKFYDRKEIKDLISYLRMLDNPADNVSLQRIINVPRRGIGNTTLATLQEAAVQMDESIFSVILDLDENMVLSSRTSSKVKEFGQLIGKLIAMKEVLPLTEFIHMLLQETNYQSSLEEENSIESQSRLDNIKEFVSAAKEFENINPGAGLTEFLENIALISDIDRMGDGQDDGLTALTMMTLHSAKGLEFPIVFLTGLEEGLFPHSRSMESEEELEEERRLCYVGITRAKKLLYITHTVQRTMYGTPTLNIPSRFINEIPGELVDCIDQQPASSGYRKSSGQGTRRVLQYSAEQSENSQSERAQQYMNAQQSPPMKPIPREVGRFTLGDKVYHTKFGNGTIVSMEGEGSNLQIKVAFIQGGIRKFLADLAPLKKI